MCKQWTQKAAPPHGREDRGLRGTLPNGFTAVCWGSSKSDIVLAYMGVQTPRKSWTKKRTRTKKRSWLPYFLMLIVFYKLAELSFDLFKSTVYIVIA